MATATQIDGQTRRPPRWWQRSWFRWLAASALGLLVCLGGSALYVSRNLQPLLRRSVVDELSQRFHSPVELDSLDIALVDGVQVSGHGLRILRLGGESGKDVIDPVQSPMLSVDHFSFRTSLHDLVFLRAHLARVEVDGLELHVPADRRGLLPKPKADHKARVELSFGEIHCARAKLVIESSKPGKEPLEFDIVDLVLRDAGGHGMSYVAEVVNPKPVGIVRATGHFGPWQGAEPRNTPIDGDYHFDNADLSTINGIGGMLSSAGHFSDRLSNIVIDGTTQTPDFSLDVSNHSEPLETRFHAIVDGTSGDTFLEPVQARLGASDFTTAGKVVSIHGQGHDIALDVNMPHGRIQDLLELGMKTQPPVMNGVVTMKAKLHIPPGKERVARKIELAGRLLIRGVEFNNPKIQDRVDGLSLRAQGRPGEVKSVSSDGRAEVASQMAVDFSLGHALVMVNSLEYDVPGAQVNMDGVYSMDGNVFEFKGHVRTDATASQMVTGWRSALLKPFDPLFKRNGAGLQLPIAVSGTKSDVHFGLAMRGADESPQDMAVEMRQGRRAGRR